MNCRWFSITILSCLWIKVIRADVCVDAACIHASATILERIDVIAHPCDDFYDFACGSFIQDTFTPDERVAVDTSTKLRDVIDAQLYTLLMDANDDGAKASLKLSKKLFNSCLGQSGVNEINLLRAIVEELGGWPLLQGELWNGERWLFNEAIAKMRKILGHRSDEVFDIASFIINPENANNPTIRPSTSTFFPLRDAYIDYISKLATFLGASAKPPSDELNHLVDFEYKFNAIYREYEQMSQPPLPSDVLKTLQLVQWLDFFHPSLLSTIQPSGDVDDANHSSIAEKFRSLLNHTSARTLANFVVVRVVDYVAAQSISGLSDIRISFQQLIDGRQDHEQQWKRCVADLTRDLPFAIGIVYIEHFVSAEAKASTIELFNNIKAEFVEIITVAEWIDESTRGTLLNKLKSLVPLIAYPGRGFDEHAISVLYEDIKPDKGHYLTTLFQLRAIDADNKLRQLNSSGVEEWRRFPSPSDVIAAYSPSDNTFRLSAGMLQLASGAAHSINYLNYGASGFIIAHEISRTVNQFLESSAAFAAKRQCLIEQYSEFREPETSERLSGERTVIENIADNTGIRLAYRAYRKWSEKFGIEQRKLIGLDYTWDQLFWLSATQTRCGVYRKEETMRRITSNGYASERFRVVGALQNSPEFAKDFNCSQLSPMNRKNKCIIW